MKTPTVSALRNPATIMLAVALSMGLAACGPTDGGDATDGSAAEEGEAAPATADPEVPPVPEDAPRVVLETSMGEILIGLYPDRAPRTVENFLAYVDSGFYDGTIFHRVMEGFMIQGGGFTPDRQRKETRDPIPLEADAGLSNLRGTVAMARTGNPDSATAQFFINHVDNTQLDAGQQDPNGYAVFGAVLEGMDVVDRIAAVSTENAGGPFGNVPTEDLLIESARRVQ